LDVRDPARVGRDGAVDVVAVAGEVVDVEQDPHVAGPRGPGPVHHGCGVGGPAQRVGLGAAHRLDEDGRADAGSGPRRVHDVRQRKLVLLLLRHPVDADPVEGVEPARAQTLADSHGHVDVVAELMRACRDRQHSGVGPGEVAGEEVQAHQADPGVADRADERVDGRVARHRVLERPPELHRAEARRPCGLGALQEGKLGEQHGAVRQVPQRMTHEVSFGRRKSSLAM
jgi:hypothetical protein